MLWKSNFERKYIFGYGKSPHGQHVITRLSHMATPWGTTEWEPALTLSYHSFSSSGPTPQTYDQWHSTHYTFHIPWRVNRRNTFNLDTVFSYRNLCDGYQITYTCRIGNILLLFVLVLTCQISTLPLQPGTMQYTIVDDDVEAAPIYKCDGKASQPTRPHENHGLHIEHIPTQMESWCKQQMQSLVVPAQGSLVNTSKIQGTHDMHVTSVVKLRIAPHTVPYGLMINDPFEWQELINTFKASQWPALLKNNTDSMWPPIKGHASW